MTMLPSRSLGFHTMRRKHNTLRGCCLLIGQLENASLALPRPYFEYMGFYQVFQYHPVKKKKNRCEGAAGAHCSLRMYERKSEESSVQLVLRDRTRVSKLASKHLIRYATPPAHRCLLCPSLPYSITQL